MPWTKMMSMELDDEDKMDMAVPAIAEQPDYPWGLRLSLSEKELDKLGLGTDELPEVGDCIHLGAFARVTSVSSNQTDSGCDCRVELQIEMLSVEEEPPDPTEEGE